MGKLKEQLWAELLDAATHLAAEPLGGVRGLVTGLLLITEASHKKLSAAIKALTPQEEKDKEEKPEPIIWTCPSCSAPCTSFTKFPGATVKCIHCHKNIRLALTWSAQRI